MLYFLIKTLAGRLVFGHTIESITSFSTLWSFLALVALVMYPIFYL